MDCREGLWLVPSSGNHVFNFELPSTKDGGNSNQSNPELCVNDNGQTNDNNGIGVAVFRISL
jgi:hypothetical protein